MDAARPVRGRARLAAVFVLALLPAAIRHWFFWGGALAPVLHACEAIALVAAALGVLWMQRIVARLPDAARSERDIVRGGALLCLCAAILPPMLTEDPVSYVVRGRVLAVHGANPYTVLAAEFAAVDPMVALAKDWAHFPLPYGPLAALWQGALAWLGELPAFLPWEARLGLTLLLFKLANAALFLACGVLAARLAAPHDAPTRARAALLVLWNPFLLLELVGNGHNDVLLVFPLLLACAAAQRDRHGRAAFWLLLSAQIKFVTLAVAPLFLVFAWRRGAMRAACAGNALGALLFAALGYVFWRQPGALGFLDRQMAQYTTPLHDLLAGLLGDHALARNVGLALVAAVLAHAALRLRTCAQLAAAIVRVFLVLIVIGLPAAFAWYHAWWAFLAPAAGMGPRRVLAALSIWGPIAYVPNLLTRTWTPATIFFQWAASIALPLLAFTRSAPRRPDPA
jgi:hypothetical protein